MNNNRASISNVKVVASVVASMAMLIVAVGIGSYLFFSNQSTAPTDSSAATLASLPGQIVVCASNLERGCNFYGAEGIQRAVNAAQSGNTIIIRRGHYFATGTLANIENKNSMTIQGDNQLTYLHSFSGTAININNSNQIGITGLVINSQNESGITIIGQSQQARIWGNIVETSRLNGIRIRDNSSGIVSNNILRRNARGIAVNNNAVFNISNNQIYENYGDGIYLAGTPRVRIVNNTFDNSHATSINMYSCAEDNPAVTITNNIISNTHKNFDNTFGYGIGGACLHDTGKLDNDVISYSLLYASANEGNDCRGSNYCSDFIGKIAADPLFLNRTDYRLTPGSSPGLNTGDRSIHNIDGSRSHMGSYGGPYACVIGSALPACSGVAPRPTLPPDLN